MNNSTHHLRSRRTAFTLIELLVVIAVIGILAALIFPITGALKKKKMITVAQAELAQVETAIDDYKAKYGTYPPDNPNPTLPGFLINQLFFELKGTVLTNGAYQTLDGSGQIPTVQVTAIFGANVTGFVNTSTSAKGNDDKAAAVNFLKDLKPTQSGALTAGSLIKVLTCSVLWDQNYPVPAGDPLGMNPWRYISTNPTNNPASYDLWVDLLISGKTNRISNWSKQPQVQ
jgi:prepilin-type N-terminal cleavage/methylation domain-containing protein